MKRRLIILNGILYSMPLGQIMGHAWFMIEENKYPSAQAIGITIAIWCVVLIGVYVIKIITPND